eukprot:gene26280-31746_t
MSASDEDRVENLQNLQENADISAASGKRAREEDTSQHEHASVVHTKLARVEYPMHYLETKQESLLSIDLKSDYLATEVSANELTHVTMSHNTTSDHQATSTEALEYSPESAFLSSLLGDLAQTATPSPPSAIQSESRDDELFTPSKKSDTPPTDVVPATPYLEVYKALRAKFRATRRTSLCSPSGVLSPETVITPIVYSQFVSSTAKELGTPEEIIRFALEGMRGIRLVEDEDIIVQLDDFSVPPSIPPGSTMATPPSPIDIHLVQQCIEREDARDAGDPAMPST